LGRAALDRVAAGAEPVARRAQLVVAEAGALPAEALRPEHLDHERAPPLVQLRPVVLEDRRLRTRGTPGLRAAARAGERRLEARLSHLDLRDAVADERVLDAATLVAEITARERHEALLVLALLEGVGDHRALETEERLRDPPAAVHAADD